MHKNQFAFISTHYDTLTPAEKRIADYILNDPHSVISMSAQELAGSPELRRLLLSVFPEVSGLKDIKILNFL